MVKSMTILHVAPWFFPATGFGGGPMGIYELSKAMIDRGHNVILYTTNMLDSHRKDKHYEKEEEIEGIIVKRFPVYFSFRQFFFTPTMFTSIFQEEADIVHGHGTRNFQSLVGIISAKRMKKPFVLSTYGCIPYLDMKDKIVKGLYDSVTSKFEIHSADLFIARSSLEAQTIRRSGGSPSRIIIIPHGVKTSDYVLKIDPGVIMRKYDLCGKNVILFVGRISPIKGLAFLIKSFKHVNKEIGSSVLLLVGPDHEHWSYLQRLIRHLNLNAKVMWIPPPPREELIGFYCLANVFVLPSLYESSPFVLFEAGALGKAVVATNVGDIPEMIKHESNGLLVNYGDTKQLASAMVNLLLNEGLAHKLGKQLKNDIMAKYSWNNLASKIESAYEKLLS